MVDPEAAEVVKRIFARTIDGYGPYQIASKLKEEKVLIPSAYLCLLYTSDNEPFLLH